MSRAHSVRLPTKPTPSEEVLRVAAAAATPAAPPDPALASFFFFLALPPAAAAAAASSAAAAALSLGSSRKALELRAQLSSRWVARSGSSDSRGGDGRASVAPTPPRRAATTVIRFSVSVPVLSEQMAVAPPIVSQAARTRTKLLSFIILRME